MLKTVKTKPIDDEQEHWVGNATDLLKLVGGREEYSRGQLHDSTKLDEIRKSQTIIERQRAKSNRELLQVQSVRQAKLREIEKQIKES